MAKEFYTERDIEDMAQRGERVLVVSDDVVALFDRSADAFEIKGDAGAPNLSDILGAQEEIVEDAAVAAP